MVALLFTGVIGIIVGICLVCLGKPALVKDGDESLWLLVIELVSDVITIGHPFPSSKQTISLLLFLGGVILTTVSILFMFCLFIINLASKTL